MTSEPAPHEPGLELAGEPDYAWASFDCPLDTESILDWLGDIELALRTNPLLELTRFEAQGPGVWRVAGRNLSNGQAIDTLVTATRGAGEVSLLYAQGLKARTTIRVAPQACGSLVTIIDHYDRVPEPERRQRLAEVDLSLTAWARALHILLRRWARWGRFAPWRWYMLRLWKPMTPSARRITFMLIAISIFEVLMVGVMLGLWYLLAS
ncbi:MAG: hypothetical protein AB7E70_05575 [Hyphomicrobiaceae bacterium]